MPLRRSFGDPARSVRQRGVRGRRVRASLPLAALAVAAAVGELHAAAPRQAAAARCDGTVWSAPRELRTARGERVYVEKPQAVRVRGGVALFGSAYALDSAGVLRSYPLDGRPAVFHAGALLRPDGHADPIPLPSGVRWLAWPRAAPTADGAAEVVWEVEDSAVTPPARQLWRARFTARGWERATRLVGETPARYAWGQIFETDLVRAGGVLHLLAAESRSFASRRVLHLRGGAEGWSAGWDSLSGVFAYTTLAALPPATLVVAYLGGDGARSSTLLTRRSTDGGARWSAATPVTRDGTDVDGVRLVATTDGAVHLLWIPRPGPGVAPVLRHAVSRDGGARWHDAPSLPLGSRQPGLEAVAGAAGALHVVLGGGDVPRPLHAAFARGRWRTEALAQPGDAFLIGVPEIAALAGDTLAILWDLRTRDDARPQALTVVSVGHPAACPRRPPRRR